ncbi:2-oxo acid dehydrogenase subunit E2 [Bacillus lacus]|uniref:Dihydrolipoamide acetyltransferase component of pyruvate dehydrogenase complex n=1 Tax=Metabacillus lacus TaxID=1983721 RepID=A0A7X2IXX0_9BACI|nr:dihydrolipoamide acetyltransferase family protein [Metabacillus lacus]MRX71835.1 2-oxo acid dehydrogenase subunit E2 [Metabacillus lacus]
MVEVKLNDIGEGMTEADINCYLVSAGDVVKADDPLVEVQTDKMTAEIPAPRAGVVKSILWKPGETVAVGTVLLTMEEEKGQNGQSVQNKEKTQASQTKRILASPYTRKMAKDQHINIEEITGTGPGGRILDSDVTAYLSSKNKDQPAVKSEQALSPVIPDIREAESDIIPFRGRRKQIGRKMAASLYTIPHCTHFEEVDVTRLIELREELKFHNRTISATCFFIKALSICLKEFPVFNAELLEEKEEIRLIKEHHIGIAVDAPEGLIVPVIQHAEQKSLLSISNEMKRLTQLALDNKLSVREISGGTFTVSNVGPLGGSIGATPIIQHPQTALISFHKTKKRPVVTEDDEIAIRSIMNVSMAFDHRVADGATAVKFTNRFAELIENPNLLLLELM